MLTARHAALLLAIGTVGLRVAGQLAASEAVAVAYLVFVTVALAPARARLAPAKVRPEPPER
jgi:hypothetical protein